ncbi:amylo-alpha-1,6-glucosidase [Carbonactinospora thermoautotrophica]|nr:amylo-alpha-1,6-glucosidase [Carbonactinospora thermoautotrophica]
MRGLVNDVFALQPLIHDALICVAAPTLVISPPDGQLGSRSGDGLYVDDVRLLRVLRLSVDGRDPEPIRAHLEQPGQARFLAVVRYPNEATQDPALVVERVRRADATVDEVTIRNTGRRRRTLRVDLTAGTDLADISDVKAGRTLPPLPALPQPGGLRWSSPDTAAVLATTPPPQAVDPAAGLLTWEVTLGPGESWSLGVTVSLDAAAGRPQRILPYPSEDVWSRPSIDCDNERLAVLIERSLADLDALLVSHQRTPNDPFLAAGGPWFLTLFGRDSLWAARMLLPLGTRLAEGTLRTLAAWQGRRYDRSTEEAPGKIPHEVRRAAIRPGEDLRLPPVYYGSIDATPLFVTVLAEAWRWGMPEAEVSALLPAAERALAWMRADGDPDDDGFLEYARPDGQGLLNQGWKDSTDAIQFADGELARPPVALAEVQAYAFEAAMNGADLLDAFGRPDGDRWREWAERLRSRFRQRYWVEDRYGAYPAIALDAEKRPVDGVGSNMAHLLGTGLLNDAEAALVARRLASEDLNSGWGLRTLGARSARFNPLGYHTGSVWPHDTAIAVLGLAREGLGETAAALLRGLLAAAPWFDYRLPELYGGEQRMPGRAPVPYPAACRPQAWSAAAGVLLLQAVLGLSADAPAGELTITPLTPFPFRHLQVRGLRVAGERLDLEVDATGSVRLLSAPAHLRLTTTSDIASTA